MGSLDLFSYQRKAWLVTSLTKPSILSDVSKDVKACLCVYARVFVKHFAAPGETITKVELMIPRTKIPANETNYFCHAFDLPNDKDYHLIASESRLDNPLTHHIDVYACWDQGT